MNRLLANPPARLALGCLLAAEPPLTPNPSAPLGRGGRQRKPSPLGGEG